MRERGRKERVKDTQKQTLEETEKKKHSAEDKK